MLVTGGARGIGAATASAAAAMGAAVVLVDRLGDVLSHTAASIALSGGHVATVVGDVRDPATVEATVDLAIGRFGRIDGVVNNAGGGFWAPFERVSAKGQAALVDENFTQVTHVVRAALPHLGRGASIVNVTSIEAHRAGPGFALYSAMKAAVENLSKSLALELAARGIRVNCVAPDMIPTPGGARGGFGSVARRRVLASTPRRSRPTRGRGTCDLLSAHRPRSVRDRLDNPCGRWHVCCVGVAPSTRRRQLLPVT